MCLGVPVPAQLGWGLGLPNPSASTALLLLEGAGAARWVPRSGAPWKPPPDPHTGDSAPAVTDRGKQTNEALGLNLAAINA